MIRTLLALPMLLCSAVAFAGEPAPTDDEGQACPKAEAAADAAPADTAGKATGHPATPPTVRPRATGATRGTPRWHSLLPGMFR